MFFTIIKHPIDVLFQLLQNNVRKTLNYDKTKDHILTKMFKEHQTIITKYLTINSDVHSALNNGEKEHIINSEVHSALNYDKKEHITLRTTCTNQHNKLVVDGKAVAMLMKF